MKYCNSLKNSEIDKIKKKKTELRFLNSAASKVHFFQPLATAAFRHLL